VLSFFVCRVMSAMQVSKDTLAAVGSACTQTVVGFPFNTVKVRLQLGGGVYTSSLQCALHIIKNDGFSGLYKGLTSMLLGQQLTNITLLASYSQYRRAFDSSYEFVGSNNNSHENFWTVPFAGCLAGMTNAFVLCPAELVSVRLQTQNHRANDISGVSKLETKYSGPVDCVKQIVLEQGGRGGLFTGLWPTITREAVGCTFWFSAYETSRKYYVSQVLPQENRTDLHGYEIAICGMTSGVSFWSMAFPFDTAKSRLQTQRSVGSGVYKGVFDCIIRVSKEEGARALYKGYNIAVLRAAFTGSSVFFTFEQIRCALG
jgi:solute carrier family 25 (mitochondrial carnitine/acylcarnitine transporter), member 20/29